MLNPQSSKSQVVYLLVFKVKYDSLGYNVLLASEGYRIPRRIDGKEGGQCFAYASSFAQSLELSPWILSKIFLAGLHDLLHLVSFTKLSGASRYFTMF